MQRNYNWLEIAEYLSIIASMIGSIAAVVTHKAVLMAAPMSMSLMLNLLHRRKLLHLSRQKIGVEVTKQCQEISDLVVSLKSSELDRFPTQEQLKQAIAAIPLEQIETCLLRLCQKVEQQQVEITQLMAALEKFSHDLPLKYRHITGIETIKQQVEQIDAAQQNLSEKEIDAIKTELSRVSAKLAQLHQQPENIAVKKKFIRIVSAIKHLRQENQEFRTSIAHLNAVLEQSGRAETNQSESQFNHVLGQISELRGSVAEVTRAIAILERQTEQIVPRSELHGLVSDLVTIEWEKSICLQPTTMDKSLSLDDFLPHHGQVKGGENGFSKSFDLDPIAQLNREVKHLSSEILTLETRMEDRIAPLEAIDRHGFEQDLSVQAKAIAQLQAQTSKLLASDRGNYPKSTEISAKIDRLENLTDRLSTQIQALQTQVLSPANSEETESLNSIRRVGKTLPTGSIASLHKSGDQCLHTFTAHPEAIFGLDFSPDGQFLITGSADHTVKLWQITPEIRSENGANGVNLCQTIAGHSHWVRAIAISPQGDFIASGSADRTGKIWPVNLTEALITEPLTTLNGYTLSLRAIAISPDGEYLASGSADRTVKIWSLRDLPRDRQDERSDSWPDSGTILTGHHGPVDAIAFSPDSQLLASGGVDCTIKIWQPNSQTLLNTLTNRAEPITALAFSPNCEISPGYVLASGSVDSAIEIWHLHPQAETAKVLTTLTGHAEAITSVKFSPDGSLLASASIDRTIKIWQLAPLDLSFSLLCTLTGHLEPVLDLGFRDSQTLASCSADGQVKLWTLYK